MAFLDFLEIDTDEMKILFIADQESEQRCGNTDQNGYDIDKNYVFLLVSQSRSSDAILELSAAMTRMSLW